METGALIGKGPLDIQGMGVDPGFPVQAEGWPGWAPPGPAAAHPDPVCSRPGPSHVALPPHPVQCCSSPPSLPPFWPGPVQPAAGPTQRRRRIRAAGQSRSPARPALPSTPLYPPRNPSYLSPLEPQRAQASPHACSRVNALRGARTAGGCPVLLLVLLLFLQFAGDTSCGAMNTGEAISRGHAFPSDHAQRCP